jgi:hypothetical protein
MEMLFLKLRDGSSIRIYYAEGNAPSYHIEWEGDLIGYMYINNYDEVSDRPLWVGSSDLLQPYLTEISWYLESALGLNYK